MVLSGKKWVTESSARPSEAWPLPWGLASKQGGFCPPAARGYDRRVGSRHDELRSLPAVDRVAAALGEGGGGATAATRWAIDQARRRIRQGASAPGFDDIVATARERLNNEHKARLRPVLNATGVLIHTNLGRAPLGPEQLDAIARIASGYSNLEYDLASGSRGSRYLHAQKLVSALTGAESALVVNNNAAALTLTLATLRSVARGRLGGTAEQRGRLGGTAEQILPGAEPGNEVIISRGELVEIGGEFRIPDVIATSGARLVEVGTTNRTHLADYERALTPRTAAILKVHPANYHMEGFVSSVAAASLARLAHASGVPLVYDVGSGLIDSEAGADWARTEPPVGAALSDGVDIVTFSCDKLLGGPQAGIIAGRADLVKEATRHPLLRSLRVDKLVLAALEATLIAYQEGRAESLPLWQMARASLDDLELRCEALAGAISDRFGPAGVKAEVIGVGAVTGGGSLPGGELGSKAVAVTHPERSTAELERALRSGQVPVIGRIEEDRLLLDLRTIPPGSDHDLHALVNAALEG